MSNEMINNKETRKSFEFIKERTRTSALNEAKRKDKQFESMISKLNKQEKGCLMEVINCFNKTIDRDTGVYFIHNKETNLIKIGCSKNIEKRISDIRKQLTNNGYSPQFRLLAVHLTFEGHERKAENFFHKRFADKRVIGEWFRISEEELQYELDCLENITIEDKKHRKLYVTFEETPELFGFESVSSNFKVGSFRKEYLSLIDELLEGEQDSEFIKELFVSEFSLDCLKDYNIAHSSVEPNIQIAKLFAENKNLSIEVSLGGYSSPKRFSITSTKRDGEMERYDFAKLKEERLNLEKAVDKVIELSNSIK